MHSRGRVGTAITHTLRAAAALGLLLASGTDFSGAAAKAPVVEARIDAPADGAQVDGVVEIRGRAMVPSGGRFAFYRILIGEGRTPVSLRPLGPPHDEPVENGLLATWDTDRFLSGDYQLVLTVYADDNSYVSASRVVTVKYKPTPTPLTMVVPTAIDIPTLVPQARLPETAPADAPPALDVVIPAFDDGAPSVQAPAPTIAPARANVPIQPIPLDRNNPGPFAVDTPTTYSPSQLPGNPAPVYITPIDFTISTP